MTNRPTLPFERSSHLVWGVLALAALVPAICVLWFMSRALHNERLAVTQRLTELYTNHLNAVGRGIDAFWEERLAALQAVPGESASSRFARMVRSDLADSVLVMEASSEVPGYPSLLPAADEQDRNLSAEWEAARELEFQERAYLKAAAGYGAIASSTSDRHLQARATMAQANCLLRGEQRDEAITLLESVTQDPRLRDAVGAQGSLIFPNAQFRLLTLFEAGEDMRHEAILSSFVATLNDYDRVAMPSLQRRFLMEQALERFTEIREEHFPTLEAERLAMSYLEANGSDATPALTSVKEMTGVWQVMTLDERHNVLYRQGNLEAFLRTMIAERFPLDEAVVQILSPEEERSSVNPVPELEASGWMPDWRLAVAFPQADPFATAYRRQVTSYAWIAIFVIGTLAVLTVVVARLLAAQMRLAQLKGDLVSTVSHELRTPLASMRALVETLLANRVPDAAQAREYLQLIAKENHRLSHLIENFLAFSRMERGRQRFHFEAVAVNALVDAAVEPLRHRLEGEGCQFVCEVASDVPDVRADLDAMTTVLINLLDNALKYTGEEKVICCRAFGDGDSICFEVEDNGNGLSQEQQAHVFQRFYQVDQSLTRERGGCGLGLSIVRSIVQAHHGRVDVTSEPGAGSTFAVRIPRFMETGASKSVEEGD